MAGELLRLVVDANVWAHAANPNDRHYADAVELSKAAMAGRFVLCVDDGWSMADDNQSRIGAEYQKWVRFGTLGYEAIVWMASHERLAFVSVAISEPDRRAVNRFLPNNKHDRHYLRLAICTPDRILGSHDFEDFTEAVRRSCRRRWNMIVGEAGELLDLVAADPPAEQ